MASLVESVGSGATAAAAVVAKPRASPVYDIFPKIAAFLDPHLMFPVLAFLDSLEVRMDMEVDSRLHFWPPACA